MRSNTPELIDLGHYTLDEYYHCLKVLDRVGRWLGGDAATLSVLNHPTSILDVGCGGGTFAMRLAKKYPHTKIVGIDLNPQAIAFAKSQNPPKNVTFECRRLDEPPKSFDVVLSTLVCHHLSDSEIVDFIQNAVRIAKKKVIFNDLQRHPLAYYLFKAIQPLFFRNRLVKNDGPLSVQRAFTYKDWVSYLEKAGIKPSQYRIKWKWAFRWIVEIKL